MSWSSGSSSSETAPPESSGKSCQDHDFPASTENTSPRSETTQSFSPSGEAAHGLHRQRGERPYGFQRPGHSPIRGQVQSRVGGRVPRLRAERHVINGLPEGLRPFLPVARAGLRTRTNDSPQCLAAPSTTDPACRQVAPWASYFISPPPESDAHQPSGEAYTRSTCPRLQARPERFPGLAVIVGGQHGLRGMGQHGQDASRVRLRRPPGPEFGGEKIRRWRPENARRNRRSQALQTPRCRSARAPDGPRRPPRCSPPRTRAWFAASFFRRRPSSTILPKSPRYTRSAFAGSSTMA